MDAFESSFVCFIKFRWHCLQPDAWTLADEIITWLFTRYAFPETRSSSKTVIYESTGPRPGHSWARDLSAIELCDRKKPFVRVGGRSFFVRASNWIVELSVPITEPSATDKLPAGATGAPLFLRRSIARNAPLRGRRRDLRRRATKRLGPGLSAGHLVRFRNEARANCARDEWTATASFSPRSFSNLLSGTDVKLRNGSPFPSARSNNGARYVKATNGAMGTRSFLICGVISNVEPSFALDVESNNELFARWVGQLLVDTPNKLVH